MVSGKASAKPVIKFQKTIPAICAGVLIPAALMALAVFFVTGCGATAKVNVEYRAEGLACGDGGGYIERYLMYDRGGEYGRHIPR